MKHDISQYDVIVVGGGIVGAATALALAQNTALHIALIDAKPIVAEWQPDHVCHRVSAISLASQQLFSHLGVWESIVARRVSPYEKMHVWDASGKSAVDFDCRAIHQPMLGFIIEDAVLRASMLERFADCLRLTVLAPLQLVSLEETADYHEIVTADGHHLRAKLVIGADGGQSWVRQAAELAVKQSDYAHTAIVTTVTTALPHQRTAWQRFLPTGPLAFLPLADAHQCSIVWSTSPAEAERLQALDHAHFQAALQAAFGDKLGAVTATAPRHLFPLERRHVTQYVKPGLALVGDAAHTLHPLAGQGVNLGLLDVVALVDGIMTALATQRDFASLPMLRRYERGRKADNAMMQGAVGALKSLFASDNICVAALRRTGMRMTNRLPILKTFIANYATNQRVELSTFMTDVKIK